MVEKINISKIVLYICITVVIIFTVRSCQLSPEVIQECQEACRDLGNRLIEVTNLTCECSGGSISSDRDRSIKWVLPGNQ